MTEDWLLEKGYSKNPDGSWQPPSVKSAYIKQQKDANNGELIVKEKVIETPDFIIKPVTEWFIPYQVPSKKNSRQTFPHPKTGKIINIPSKGYKEYVDATKRYWETFGKEFRKTIEITEIKYPLNIEMTFIRKTNQLVDYFGPGESVFDLMTDFNWWPDDNKNYGKPFFGDMIVDKNNPGVKIKILHGNI